MLSLVAIIFSAAVRTEICAPAGMFQAGRADRLAFSVTVS